MTLVWVPPPVPYAIVAMLGMSGLILGQQPTFRTRIDLVQVDAVVTDRADRPVRDLSIADFEIVEDGRPQTVAEFRFVHVPPGARNVPAAVVSAPRDTAANEAIDGRLFVLLIDDLHITLDTPKLARIKEIITQFLRDLTPADQVAVVYTSRSDLSQDFTNDLAAQVRALDRFRDALGGTSITPLTWDHDARSSLRTLRNVIAAMSGSPHSRRAVVYVAEEVVAPRIASELLDLYEASVRSNVPVYAIDPRGLMTISGYDDIGAQRAQKDSLHEMALNTGGRAFVERSSMPRAVEELVAENGSFYLLGYYPEPLARDGKVHRIEVRVKRPGVRVRARRGYVAARADASIAAGAPAPLEHDLRRGLMQFGVPLRAFAAPIAVATDERIRTAVTLEVTYPPRDQAMAGDRLEYALLAIDHDGRSRGASQSVVTVPALEGRDAATFVIHDVLDLPAGPITLRLGVRSGALNGTGTVSLPVAVPKLDDDRIAMSGIAIGRAVPVLGSAHSDRIAGLLPIEPTAGRAFQSTAGVPVFVRLFWRARDGKSAVVTIALRQGGKTIRTEQQTVAGQSGSRDRLQADARATLSLGDLSPGDYELALEARAGQGPTARRAVPFAIRELSASLSQPKLGARRRESPDTALSVELDACVSR